MRVLGIDPGLRNMGWGVIEVIGSRVSHVANGTCRSEGSALAERLLSLHAALSEIVGLHAPQAAAVGLLVLERANQLGLTNLVLPEDLTDILVETAVDETVTEEAIRRLREAVEIDPEPAEYWNSLGMVLGAHGRLAEAVAAFRQAHERGESDPRYSFNIGLALLRLGHSEEARGYFEATLELDPGFEAARAHLAEMGT